MPTPSVWDYLILTASNAMQARAYESHLRLRTELGLLPQVRESLVVPDLEGRRIGSGGSTVWAIAEAVNRERRRRPADAGKTSAAEILRGMRILVVHAGGDSRRLPAYGPCGKIFVPVPGQAPGALPATLFDRLVPDFLELPEGAPGRGQIVVAAGDALIRLDAAKLRLERPGITALGCYAEPLEASRHGVYCMDSEDSVRLYLQKPSVAEQAAAGAINASGKAALDLGVMSLDADAAAVLLTTFGIVSTDDGRFAFAGPARDRILRHGVDLYREICCAMGDGATASHYVRSARASGSTWSENMLVEAYPALRRIPFHVQLVAEGSFLHFGSTRQLIESGLSLAERDQGRRPASGTLMVNDSVSGGATITGPESWVEGCRISAALDLAGKNVVIGVNVSELLSLPRGACLDVLRGRNRSGNAVWFVRCYGVNDTFKDSVSQGTSFCGRPLLEWISAVGIDPGEVWPDQRDPADRSAWNARLFPAEPGDGGFRRWLWMYAPQNAGAAEKRAFSAADRYSAAEIAIVADQDAFHRRRIEVWADEADRAGMAPNGWVARVRAAAESRFRPAP
jgi:fucokinase